MPDRGPSPITVLAGPNGGGKSSVAGRALAENGGHVFDPDAVAAQLVARDAAVGQAEADSIVWHEMVAQLENAIARGRAFTFETTLGGRTIASVLAGATDAGADVRVWYVALADADAHIARVRRRVALGGHDVPDERVRQRYDASRRNLAALVPVLSELRVLDNSRDAAGTDTRPEPALVLHMRHGAIVEICGEDSAPAWAAEIIAAARWSDSARRRR